CHRPGQTKDVYVHYVLGLGTMEEQMWRLLNQKAAAQRAVFDKEAQFKSVEDVMSEAVSAQMQVAKAVVEIERAPLLVETTPEAATPQPTSQQPGPTMADGAPQPSLAPLSQKPSSRKKQTRRVAVFQGQQLSMFDLLAQSAE
ncbi:MAG: hypothetical protein MUQ10_17970, partial [Anaerolineae bacterium]|nr:hypothetical protein [Anaerolineae bacterium]